MKNCDECGMKPANIHLTQVMNNETEVFHLCDECAKKKGISISVDNVLEQSDSVVVEKNKRCDSCGLNLSEFRSTGLLGCSGCYTAFENEIDELLVQVHGSAVHKGKRYLNGAEGEQKVCDCDIERLRREMELAIRNEEFEQAAAIRDVIHNLKEMGVQ